MSEPTEAAIAGSINFHFVALPLYVWDKTHDDGTKEVCIGFLCFQFFMWCGPSAHRLANEEGE